MVHKFLIHGGSSRLERLLVRGRRRGRREGGGRGGGAVDRGGSGRVSHGADRCRKEVYEKYHGGQSELSDEEEEEANSAKIGRWRAKSKSLNSVFLPVLSADPFFGVQQTAFASDSSEKRTRERAKAKRDEKEVAMRMLQVCASAPSQRRLYLSASWGVDTTGSTQTACKRKQSVPSAEERKGKTTYQLLRRFVRVCRR